MRLLAFLLLVLAFRSCAVAQHSNSLSWTTPVVSAPVVISGYAVYRGTTPGGYVKGTPLIKVTAPSYVDTTVKSGNVFYYAVTALCGTCTVTESPFSAEVKAQTPADSAPPAISTPGFVIISR